MATKTAKTKKRAVAMPRAYAKITVQFGLVSIPVAIRPTAGDRNKEVSGKMLCGEHDQQIVTQLWHCEEGDHTMKKAETKIGYETSPGSGEYVSLDESVVEELVADREAAAEVKVIVPVDEIDPVFYEKTYTLWPQDGAEQPHDLFAAVLRNNKLAAIVEATISKQTRAFAIRWSDAFQTLVCSLLFFNEDLRWADSEAISSTIAERVDSITDAHLDAAKALVVGLEGEFDADEVENTYVAALKEAIAAAASGTKPKLKGKTAAPKADSTDLLAILKASVTATKPKATRKPKEKVSV